MMKVLIKNRIDSKADNEGSSLAIALVFFLLCSLMCAGILYLANSSSRGVSKSLDTYKPFDRPEITQAVATPTHDPAHEKECQAVDMVFNYLVYDFDTAFKAAENGENTRIYRDPEKPTSGNKLKNLTYEILSYVHAYYDNNKGNNLYVEVINGEMQPKEFTVTVKDLPGNPKVKVIFDLDGTQGSACNGEILNNNPNKNVYRGLNFQVVKITVKCLESSGCTYERSYEYTVPNADQGAQFYIRWSQNGGYQFLVMPVEPTAP